MSKVDTLKAAMVYIQELKNALGSDSPTDSQLPSDNDSLFSTSDSSPCSQDDFTENFFYGEGMTSDGYSDGLSSPSSSPTYQSAPTYIQSNYPTYPAATNDFSHQLAAAPQQYPSNQMYQWPCSTDAAVHNEYQQNSYMQTWEPAGSNMYPSEERYSSEEESILDMVSYLF